VTGAGGLSSIFEPVTANPSALSLFATAASTWEKASSSRAGVEAQYANLRPRLLSRLQAAAYCNISPNTFSGWVRSGRLPPPLPGTTRWDLNAIDAALDALSGLTIKTEGVPSPLDE
jgi:hypothetical protein